VPEVPQSPPSRHERRRRRARRRTTRRAPAGAIAALAIVWAAGAVAVALVVVAGAPDRVIGCHLASGRAQRLGSASFLYAADGSRLGAVPARRNREPVALARMGRWLPAATVAIEDRRFWQHGALDYRGIARAAVADLRAKRIVQGGSTLTQQLVRNRYLDGRPMTVSRKLEEACLAVQLARAWPRRRILQAYLNSVFYGQHAYGVEAAARTYFSRPARALTLDQAALLAGLPQAPSVYDPLRHPKAALARRTAVLNALWRAGRLSAARRARAVTRPLRLRPSERYRRARAATFFGFAVRALERRVGRRRAARGGLRVQTTLDPRLQRLARQAIAGRLTHPADPAAALVAIDPRTGAIRAMTARAPGRPLRFNLASQSRRQAGSAFKVFTLVAALERGIPLSSVWQGPPALAIPASRCPNGNGPWLVHNFADEKAGTMTLRQAIAQSVNTIFAQVVARVGPGRVVAVAHAMGVRSPLVPVCSITLGPEGVSPLDMTSAFATLAAGGVHRPARALARVTTGSGRPLVRPQATGRRVVPAGVAGAATSTLTGVVRFGTGVAADPGRPAAGKTGTAESFKDAWFCGYVRQLATCVWVGYPRAEIPLLNVEGFPQVFGGSIPALIWHDFTVAALRGRPVRPLLQRAPAPAHPAARAPAT
jgi:penicillin-binding protein 1A